MLKILLLVILSVSFYGVEITDIKSDILTLSTKYSNLECCSKMSESFYTMNITINEITELSDVLRKMKDKDDKKLIQPLLEDGIRFLQQGWMRSTQQYAIKEYLNQFSTMGHISNIKEINDFYFKLMDLDNEVYVYTTMRLDELEHNKGN